MRISCLGAAGQVTGSCFYLNDGQKYLVDCGLFQGGRTTEALNRQEWPFDPADISAVLLTHAHIDHSGRLPKLVKDGFKGKIYCTLPTAELCKIMLLDSANIQEMETEWESRKNRRRGDPDVEPLYTVADAEACLPLFQPIEINEMLRLSPDMQVRFRNSGHILGSSILEMWCGTDSKCHKIVFSGDLGRKDQLIVQDPYAVAAADSLFVESTYGNRNHKSFDDSKSELIEAIHYSSSHNEKVIIPAFAVERTQEILYVLGDLFRRKLIPSMPVYLDSPLAIAATEIFRRMRAFYDEDALAIVNQGHDPFNFPELSLSRTTQDSMEINQREGRAIVIAGNGMCTAGRIKHHLKHNLWRQGSAMVIAGFQAEGSLGRKIVDGAKSVKVFGENILVRAKVFTIGGFSAHAGQSDLLAWVGNFQNPDMKVYVIHGEREASEVLAREVHNRFGLKTVLPQMGETIDLQPSEHEEITAAPAARAEWQRQLAETVRKAKELRELWEQAPQTLPPELLQEMESELKKTGGILDAILTKAKAAEAQRGK